MPLMPLKSLKSLKPLKAIEEWAVYSQGAKVSFIEKWARPATLP